MAGFFGAAEIKQMNSAFNISKDTMVVTSKYVTDERLPILDVTHEDNEEGGSLWQFHCGNGDYSLNNMRLVRLDTILGIDPSVIEVADLKMGQTATRRDPSSPWIISSVQRG